MVCPRRAVRRDDIVRAGGAVKPADSRLQLLRAENCTVSHAPAGERIKKFPAAAPREAEKLIKAHGIDAGLRDIVFRLCFVEVHPFFDFECGYLHLSAPFL
ncbi:hypothetical protein SDC9_178174 [bioreactor metagenome]|uniref:Uncharacterized protein n=1 Tax=bioreactor metagenome TaxID=1076179 RepID=A0A645H4E7_9ZZZZ